MSRNNRPIWFAGLALALVLWLTGIGLYTLQHNAANTPATLPTQAVLPTVTPAPIVARTGVPAGEQVTLPRTSDQRPNTLQRTGDQTADARLAPVPDRVIVQFSADSTDAQREAFRVTYGDQILAEIPVLNRVVLRSNTAPDVAYIAATEPDYYVQAQVITSDPYSEQQWALEAIGVASAWSLDDEPARVARVAVIDSGVCLDHPELAGRLSAGWDYVEGDATPQDEFDHGCGVTGIIAANIDNGVGMAGLVPDVQIMPLRVLDADGIGTYSDVAQAIIRATDAGVQFINLSLGGYQPSDLLAQAVTYATERGVTVIAAAGNTGSSAVLYPARYPQVIAVGAVDQALNPAGFSSRGDDVTAWAPGVDILTLATGGDVHTVAGTSYAAPHVTGIAVLMRLAGQDFNAAGQFITLTATDQDIEPTPTGANGRPTNSTPSPAPILTDEWVVQVAFGASAPALAQRLGFEYVAALPQLPDFHIFRIPQTAQSAQAAGAAASALSASAQVVAFEQQQIVPIEKRVPTDPNYAQQWHLNNTGQSGGIAGNDARVVGAWNAGFTGQGVVMAVVDDGLQRTHPDIVSNYDAIGSYDFNSNDTDPMPMASTDGHGTSAGGVMAAADDANCGVGAAYNAGLSGIRLIAGPVTDATIANALSYQPQHNAIYNNSWGPPDDGKSTGGPGIALRNALFAGVKTGRGDLGSIYVFASGNGLQQEDNSNADGFSNSRYTISVSATTHQGTQAWYSEPGAPTLINAPSNGGSPYAGVVTTDLMGTGNGYDNNTVGMSDDCTDNFGGTSSAAPLVSGIIGLMLEANPNLTYRDVQHVLVNTAVQNHAADASWRINGAGRPVSHKYGFGRVDAAAAVTLSQNWNTVSPEISYISPLMTVNQAIPDGVAERVAGAPLVQTFTVPANIRMEHVELLIDATHEYRGDLIITLESPSGHVSEMMTLRPADNNTAYNWLFSSVQHWDEIATGTWTLRIYDGWDGFTGTLNTWQMAVYGTDAMTTPPNDLIESAIFLGETANRPLLRHGDEIGGSTTSGSDPTSTCGIPWGSVWYRLTATDSAPLRVVIDSTFEATLSVWRDMGGGNLSEAGCHRGTYGDVSFTPSAGTYYIMVARTNPSHIGDFSLYVGDAWPASDVIVVNSTASGATACSIGEQCNLSNAISYANSTGADETIVFDLEGFDGHTLNVSSALPSITDTLTIDGTTQAGYTLTNPFMIELRGPGASFGVNGLSVSNSANLTLRGMSLVRFSNAVLINANAGSAHLIENNRIGMTRTGQTNAPNTNGLYSARPVQVVNNTIAGNTGYGAVTGTGVTLTGNVGGSVVRGNSITANSIGVRLLDGTTSVTIGGTTGAHANTIRLNTGDGIHISNAHSNTIVGNIVDANSGIGIHIQRGNNNLIGTTTGYVAGQCAGGCNRITSNGSYGVLIHATGTATGNQIANNWIGLAPNGTGASANGGGTVPQVQLNNHGNTLGGATVSHTNLIVGSADYLVHVTANNTTIRNNRIGLNANGTASIIGTAGGIRIASGTGNAISDNLISGNTTGIRLDVSATVNNNRIGLNAAGTGAVANTVNGVLVTAGANGATLTNNTISGNGGAGVRVTDAANVTLTGNRIGWNVTASADVPNQGHGLHLDGASGAQIGGAGSLANRIAHNTGAGVAVTGNALNNHLSGNSYQLNGGLAIDLGADGVTVNDAQDADTGANTLQNYPQLTGVTFDVSETELTGTLDSVPSASYTVTAYFNAACDASTGYGEGQTVAGTVNVNTDGNGLATFTLIAGVPPTGQDFITLTATDASGNTSEFSRCSFNPPATFSAIAVSQVRVDLTWGNVATGTQSLNLQQSGDGGVNWSPVQTFAANSTGTTMNDLLCGTTYTYRLQAINGDQVSPYAITSATTDACPPNDDRANALVVGSLPYMSTQAMFGASPEAGDPTPICGTGTTRTIWYTYTPAQSGEIWFDTAGSDFDTVLAVYDNSMNPLVCDNDGGLGVTSFIRLNVTAGQTVYIMLAGQNGTGGNAQLTVTGAILPTPTFTPTNTPAPTTAPDPVTNTVGLYQAGMWSFRDANMTGSVDLSVVFGSGAGWQPVTGDWNGDGTDGIGLYRDGVWLLRMTTASGAMDVAVRFGANEAGWQAVAGDWNGDGITGLGLYRAGQWRLKQTPTDGAADMVFTFDPFNGAGQAIAGDWNGDGFDTVGLHHLGVWSLSDANSATAFRNRFNFGQTVAGWLPVAGDWNQDGVDTIGLYRDGVWRLRNSNSTGGADTGFNFSAPGVPIANYRGGVLGLNLMNAPVSPTATPTISISPTATTAPATIEPTPVTPTATQTVAPTATSTPSPTATPTGTSTPTAPPD